MVDSPILEEKTDPELVRLTLDNPDNFSYLVKRYQDKLFVYIKRISSFNDEEAEDVLQDVFIKVYTHLNDYDQDLKFSSWIYRIAHNQVISSFRKLKARPEGQKIDIDESGLNNIASDIDIVNDLDSNILRDSIDDIMNRIDDKYREALVLKYLEEKSYDEISDILKKPIGTVGTLINRGKKQFKEEFLKQGKIYEK